MRIDGYGMGVAQENTTSLLSDDSINSKTSAIDRQMPLEKSCNDLESRGESGDGSEAKEGRVEGNTGSTAVLAILAVDLAVARGVVAGVLVGLLVLAGAGEGALDLAVAALGARGELLKLGALLADIGRAGDVKGTANVVELAKVDAKRISNVSLVAQLTILKEEPTRRSYHGA